MAQSKRRLDEELVAQGFYASASEAARAVMAGLVYDDYSRKPYTFPGQQVVCERALYVKGHEGKGQQHYVSRGGLKLQGALEAFGLSDKIRGLDCIDVGCSTGGFTDCLLQAGAASVCAVDVGYAQFDWALRNDARVDLHERTHIAKLADDPSFAARFDLLVCDVSFTSIIPLLSGFWELLKRGALVVSLIKPQFEAAKSEVDTGGIVRDKDVHLSVLRRCSAAAREQGFELLDLCRSPIEGAKGNREFFLVLKKPADQAAVDLTDAADFESPELIGSLNASWIDKIEHVVTSA